MFPDVTFFLTHAPVIGEPRCSAEFGASFLASGTHGQFTWLPEYFKSKAEAAVERAQIGWRIDDRNAFWLGRMHTPLCFWITTNHHVTYLQTTHRRRLIDDFEDGGSAEPGPHRNGGTVRAALRTDDVSTDEYDISVHQFNALGGNQLKR